MRRCRARELESLKGWLSRSVFCHGLSADRSLYFTTSFTHVGFFACVNSSMHSQCRPLYKLLLTARMLTHVRSDTAVNPLCISIRQQIGRSYQVPLTMTSKIASACKSFAASSTSESLDGIITSRGTILRIEPLGLILLLVLMMLAVHIAVFES